MSRGRQLGRHDQLVRIAGDEDRDDATLLDLQRGGLQGSVARAMRSPSSRADRTARAGVRDVLARPGRQLPDGGGVPRPRVTATSARGVPKTS
ncbi:MAG: hypothetical protein A2792_11840 [Sphingomonadales bacterium RIFCSPHIGHO2_01_FULL_65_20]|nr:MAG: hypothetical protein A2792_11840 [Sphingomonadales bacterium RIFCSPHIGHO2_01_FULL_65_20]